MTAPWSQPPIDEAAANAIAALEEPSRPGPLPGSRRIGERSWRIDITPAEVLQQYQAEGAPVPTGSTVIPAGDTVVIRAPFSGTVVLFEETPAGARYSLVPGPTVRIDSTVGSIPVGEYFVPCGMDTIDLNTGDPQLTAVAAFEQDGQHWLWMLNRPDESSDSPASTADAGGSGQPPAYVVVLGSYDPSDPASFAAVVSQQFPCTATEHDGVLTANFTKDGADVTVTAARTTSATGMLMRLVPQPPKLEPALRISCVSKISTGPMDQRITGVGGSKDGKPWRLSTEELITRLHAGEKFYLQQTPDDPGMVVEVATGASGHDYPLVKDGRVNLVLGLPKCHKVKNPLPGP